MANTDNFWWYITLHGPAGLEDVLSSAAENSGCIGSTVTNDGDVVDLQVYYRANQDLGEWLKMLQPYLETWNEIEIKDMGQVENRVWNTEWMDAFPPLNVGKKLVIKAPWHAGREDAGRLPVFIYPGAAFGAGYHQSAQAVLELMERWLKPGDVVADIGCGTAILSIAALKMGAKRAYVRDLDSSVIREAMCSMLELNGITEEKLDIADGTLLKDFKHKVDLLLINILCEPDMAVLPSVAGTLNSGGRAIFAGLTIKEVGKLKEKLAENGLRLIDEVQLEDWGGLAVDKL